MSKDWYSSIITMEDTFLLNIFSAPRGTFAYTILHELLYHHIEVHFIMPVKDAIAKRFEQLCAQRGIRPNELATRAGAYSKIDLLFHS